jgi:hypothetical protein
MHGFMISMHDIPSIGERDWCTFSGGGGSW